MPFRHDVTARRRTPPYGLVKGDICIRIAPLPSVRVASQLRGATASGGCFDVRRRVRQSVSGVFAGVRIHGRVGRYVVGNL
jgi:hypothetical protein